MLTMQRMMLSRRRYASSNGYFLSEPTLKALKFLLLSRKDLILAAPHAGSTRMIERTCLDLGDEVGAKIHSIDYLSLVKHKENAGQITKYRLERDEKLTKAFSPGSYQIEDGNFDDEYEDDLEDDEAEDEQSTSLFNFKHPFKPAKRAFPKITVNLNIAPEKGSGPESLEKTFKLSSFSFGAPAAAEEVQKSTGTIYDTALSDNHINSYLTNLKQSVDDLNLLGEETKSFIILVKDTTDMLETPGNSGKRFFYGLMDVVEQLRNDGINACLIAASSPSLVDSKNIDKDLDFYSQIMDGSLPNMAKKGSDGVSIASDGTLFDTCLDSLPDRFQKIQLLPPSPNFTALQTGKEEATHSGRTKRHTNKFTTYLAKLDLDLKGRLAEMNCSLLEYLASLKSIKIEAPVWNLLTSTEVEGQKFLPKPFLSAVLSQQVWTIEEGNRILLIACGARISNLKLNSVPEELSLQDLTDALEIVYETDIRRCALVGFEEKITPARVDPESGGSEDGGKTVKNEEDVENSKVNAKTGEGSQYDHEKITADLKRRGVKLNTHEKRILSTVVNPANIITEFSDLILPANTKLVLQTLVTLPLLRPKYFASGILSKSSINGVLMFGPPGTGKTMLAKAVAKSSGAWFMNVALSDIFEKYVGEGEKNVRAIFSLARKLSGPCVIFLDEVDAVFSTRRNDSSGSSKREIMNEFMSEWDGLMSNNQGIVVLGATNRPFDLDDAILRRMPRRILIDLPDEGARAKILNTHLKGESLDETVDIQKLAKITPNYSGSDLKNVCVSAALARIKENILLEHTKNEERLDSTAIKQKIAEIDDWGNFLSNDPVEDAGNIPLASLSQKHFDIGLAECPPSLSEEMETLVELRKWDGLYGDGASKRKQKPNGIGFALVNP